MKKITIIGLIVILFTLTSQVVAYQYDTTNEKESPYNVIKEFSNLTDMELQSIGHLSMNSGEFDIFYSKNSYYYVNPDLGIVEAVVFLKSPDLSKIIRITQSDAEMIARQFAIDHYRNFTLKNFQLIDAYLIDHDSGGKEYNFIWREFFNSVATPNFVQVSVNPESGTIISYSSQQRDIEVPLLAKITKDEAIDTAIACFPKIKIQRESIPASLSIEYMTPKTQVLTWIITIEGNSLNDAPWANFYYGGIVVIDAQTGKVLQISEWG